MLAAVGVLVGVILTVGLARAASKLESRSRVRAMRPAARFLPERFRSAVAVRLARAELDLDPEAAVRWWAVSLGVTAWFAMVLAPTLVLPAVAAGVAAGPVALALRTGRADRAARGALPGILDHVVAHLRAGGTVHEAVQALANRPGPLAADFRRLVARLSLGSSIDDALERWGNERPVAGVRTTAGALAMVVAVGGSAASPLEGLATSLRDDEAAAGEAKALSAQSRLSAMVVGVGPIAYLVFSTATDPASARVLVSTPVGIGCLAVGLTLEVVAALWMRALLKDPT